MNEAAIGLQTDVAQSRVRLNTGLIQLSAAVVATAGGEAMMN